MKREEDQHPRREDPGLRAPRDARELQDLRDLNLTSDLSWDKLNNKLERKGRHPTPSHTCKHRSDRLGLVDLQVYVDLRDLKGSWDHRETPETPAHLDLRACKASLGYQVLRVKKERLGLTERPDYRDPLANLVKEDCQECPAFQAPKDTEDFLDWMEPKVTLVHLERRARMVPLVLWVQLDPLDRQAPEENVGEMVPQE